MIGNTRGQWGLKAATTVGDNLKILFVQRVLVENESQEFANTPNQFSRDLN